MESGAVMAYLSFGIARFKGLEAGMATGFEAEDRTVLHLSGADCEHFLQDLVSNDISGGGLVYAALLSPQGKYLFDFFVWSASEGDSWFVDVATSRAQALAQRLTMYKLRADVSLEASDLRVFQVWGGEDGFADPRHADLGRRVYTVDPLDVSGGPNWDALRVAHVVPETGIELIADGSFILECGFERLNGVDFKKGCYVGQEVTARMKHKTELRKGLAQVTVAGEAPEAGTEIKADGKSVGQLFTSVDGLGIAYVRFDRAKGEMTAGDAIISLA